MLQFKRLNKKLLLEYANSNHFGKGTDIPISFHRAISQSLNPRLNSTDILLILAIDEGRLVGYTGILPDKLFDTTGKSNRFGWLSCLWVSPTARNKGIGKRLIEEAVKAWDGRILSSDYAPETKGLYDASGAFLTTPFELEGLRLYIKSDLQNLLPPKHKTWVKLKPALTFFDFLANKVDFSDMVRLVKQRSRNYAKRQLTWFRKNKRIQWFNPDDYNENSNELINIIIDKL